MNGNGIIKDYLDEAWWTKENANIQYSVSAMNRDIAGSAAKNYWLTQVYDDEIREAYKNRLFHIHDLSFIGVYCVGWSLEDILLKGFRGQLGTQTSAPAKHFSSALGQVYNFLYTLQNEAAGAEALSNFDTYLAPFIHYDNMTQEEVDQAMQVFKFNMNVKTRQANQSPFTNITLDQQVPKFMEDEYTIRDGKYTDDTYGSFQKEMDMINEAWWKQVIRGDSDGRPQPFPIETLNVTEDFNWDDELLFRAIAKRGSAYFSNFIVTDMKPEESRSMCCRLRLDLTKLERKGGGFFGASPQTGSIGVCTLNMPLLAYLSKDEDRFFELIGYSMDTAKRSLELKRQLLEDLTNRTPTLYPFTKYYLQSVYDRFGRWWANHFNTIGLVGMNEACLNLINEDISTGQGLDLSVKVLEFMRKRALEYQDETGSMYNIEATPAESTSYRLALHDKQDYPDIITSGSGDSMYYTNSTNLAVGIDMPLGGQLEHQQQLQPLYTGGSVNHIWNNNANHDWETVSRLMKRIMYNYELPYVTYSPTTSVCPNCGYLSGEYHECPTCGSPCEVWQRVTGFFSLVSNYNKGKKQEYKERKSLV